MTEAVEKIQELRAAQTLGDVFRVDLPVTVHVLENPDIFNNAVTFASPYSETHLRPNQDGVVVPTYESDEPELYKGFGECLEHVQLLEETGQRSQDGQLSRGFQIEASGWMYGMVQNTASGLHVDNVTKPKSRVYMGSTQGPTLVVPNHKALEIMEQFPIAQTLDWTLSAGSEFDKKMLTVFDGLGRTDAKFLLEGETAEDRKALVKALEEALEPAEAGALTMTNGLGFHNQNTDDQKDRIFFRALAFG